MVKLYKKGGQGGSQDGRRASQWRTEISYGMGTYMKLIEGHEPLAHRQEPSSQDCLKDVP